MSLDLRDFRWQERKHRFIQSSQMRRLSAYSCITIILVLLQGTNLLLHKGSERLFEQVSPFVFRQARPIVNFVKAEEINNAVTHDTDINNVAERSPTRHSKSKQNSNDSDDLLFGSLIHPSLHEYKKQVSEQVVTILDPNFVDDNESSSEHELRIDASIEQNLDSTATHTNSKAHGTFNDNGGGDSSSNVKDNLTESAADNSDIRISQADENVSNIDKASEGDRYGNRLDETIENSIIDNSTIEAAREENAGVEDALSGGVEVTASSSQNRNPNMVDTVRRNLPEADDNDVNTNIVRTELQPQKPPVLSNPVPTPSAAPSGPRINYASGEDGAKIIMYNIGSKGVNSLLYDNDDDAYLITPCTPAPIPPAPTPIPTSNVDVESGTNSNSDNIRENGNGNDSSGQTNGDKKSGITAGASETNENSKIKDALSSPPNVTQSDTDAIVRVSSASNDVTENSISGSSSLNSHTEVAYNKYFVVELIDEVVVDAITIANYELYSSGVKEFELYGSSTRPVGSVTGSYDGVGSGGVIFESELQMDGSIWVKLNDESFVADNVLDEQIFSIIYDTMPRTKSKSKSGPSSQPNSDVNSSIDSSTMTDSQVETEGDSNSRNTVIHADDVSAGPEESQNDGSTASYDDVGADANASVSLAGVMGRDGGDINQTSDESNERDGKIAYKKDLVWVKYLLFAWKSHHGTEHYCTLSKFHVHGLDALAAIKMEVEIAERALRETETIMSNAITTNSILTSNPNKVNSNSINTKNDIENTIRKDDVDAAQLLENRNSDSSKITEPSIEKKEDDTLKSDGYSDRSTTDPSIDKAESFEDTKASSLDMGDIDNSNLSEITDVNESEVVGKVLVNHVESESTTPSNDLTPDNVSSSTADSKSEDQLHNSSDQKPDIDFEDQTSNEKGGDIPSSERQANASLDNISNFDEVPMKELHYQQQLQQIQVQHQQVQQQHSVLSSLPKAYPSSQHKKIDTELYKLILSKLKNLEYNQSVIDHYLESLHSRYSDILVNLGKRIGELESSCISVGQWMGKVDDNESSKLTYEDERDDHFPPQLVNVDEFSIISPVSQEQSSGILTEETQLNKLRAEFYSLQCYTYIAMLANIIMFILIISISLRYDKGVRTNHIKNPSVASDAPKASKLSNRISRIFMSTSFLIGVVTIINGLIGVLYSRLSA